ncbi:hypothetical protein GCM10023347_22850 [Streptomyces chumphonensis]
MAASSRSLRASGGLIGRASCVRASPSGSDRPRAATWSASRAAAPQKAAEDRAGSSPSRWAAVPARARVRTGRASAALSRRAGTDRNARVPSASGRATVSSARSLGSDPSGAEPSGRQKATADFSGGSAARKETAQPRREVTRERTTEAAEPILASDTSTFGW